MSRPLRLEHSGAIWHVTSRGNERGEVFRDEVDREKWLEVAGRVAETAGWRVHAYVLMGNHYHLLVETPKPTLSKGMRQLNGIYTQAFNRRHRRVGHLFQGRYKAILVERESYLLELIRYVVRNPVRAKMVRTVGVWPWSSYRATAGEGPGVPWLETGWVLSQFGRRRAEAQRRYRAFVSAGRSDPFDPWSAVRGQIYLGSDEFVRGASEEAASRTVDREIPRSQREVEAPSAAAVLVEVLGALRTTEDELRSHPRKKARERSLVAYVLRRFAGATGNEIGPLLGVSGWRASSMARQGEGCWGAEGVLRRRLEGVFG